MSSSSSKLCLTYLVQIFFFPTLSSSGLLLLSYLTNLQLHFIYTALGGIAKQEEKPKEVMTFRVI